MENNKVSDYRKVLGITQLELADYLGISTQSVSNKERGATPFKEIEQLDIIDLLLPHFPSITINDIFNNAY